MGSIYKITNTVNDKSYIGKTIHDAEKTRVKQHLYGHGNKLLNMAVKKYGVDVFAYEILHDGIIPELLDSYEIEEITKHNTVSPNGYNLTHGGDGCSASPETRVKISKALKGKKRTHKQNQKNSEARKGEKSWNYGKTPSPETRRKISEAKKGKTFSDEHRRKLSASRTGNTLSPETRQKISKKMKTKTFSDEHRRKMSEAQKRRWQGKKSKSNS